ncbi:MAG: tetratricopeptide repeat protein [Prochlorothrix sp.]
MAKQRKGDFKKKLILVLGLVGFVNLMGRGLVQPLVEAVRGNGADGETAAVEQANPLVGQEQGYEMVLEREPNNTTALRGLVDIRKELGDVKGAIEALDQLIALAAEGSEEKVNLQAEREVLNQQLAATPQESR